MNKKDIQAIIDNRQAESRTLEFKKQPWGNGDKEKKETLKDITALSNTLGGRIIIGVSEKAGCADSIVPVSRDVAEGERSRIEGLIASGTDPRLRGVMFETVAVEGGFVLVIDVPQSFSRPHRVTIQNSNRFWLRNSTGVYEPDTSDLRKMFTEGFMLAERTRKNFIDRFELMLDKEKQIYFTPNEGVAFLSIYSSNWSEGDSLVDIKEAYDKRNKFPLIKDLAGSTNYCSEGLLRQTETHEKDYICRTLIRRDGCVEITYNESIHIPKYDPNDRALIVKFVEYHMMDAITKNGLFDSLLSIGFKAPFFIFLGIGGISDVFLTNSIEERTKYRIPIRQNKLILPSSVIESASDPQNVGIALANTFDALWQAGGYQGSPNFKENGWERPKG